MGFNSGFKGLIKRRLRTALFWVTQRVVVIPYRRFGRTYLYHFREFSDLDHWRWARRVIPKRQQGITDVSGQPICTIFKSTVTLTLKMRPMGCPETSAVPWLRFGTNYLYHFQEYSDLDSWRWARWVVPNRRQGITDVSGNLSVQFSSVQ